MIKNASECSHSGVQDHVTITSPTIHSLRAMIPPVINSRLEPMEPLSLPATHSFRMASTKRKMSSPISESYNHFQDKT